MKTYPLNEPQRVTRYGKESIVIISEQTWQSCGRSAPTLGALLASHVQKISSNSPKIEDIAKEATDRPWKNRPLGSDFD